MKKIFSNENIRNIRLYVHHEIMEQAGEDKKDIAKCRFAHIEKVAVLSWQIFNLYLKEYKRTNKKYNKENQLSKSDFKQIEKIVKLNANRSILFMGIIHDLYKMYESDKKSHGELAADWFTSYCKTNKYKMKGVMKDIRDAVKHHSNKDKKTKNIYYKILCDADVLSKYSVENAYEKSILLDMNLEDALKNSMNIIEKEKKYKGKTPFFNYLRDVNKRKVIEQIKMR